MDVGVPRCWNGSPELVSAALVGPQRGGQTTLSASQVAAGSKRLRTVELGTATDNPDLHLILNDANNCSAVLISFLCAQKL
ncbi:jg20901 [Pararge aegeria aegeria]|uniref:Jg20901 protein n=1 Tax=Pararge aegeria aegeria TaxID=348720 RepID=A0A8S4RKW1_9NEOP|nr:jg20901 [Pararge aegeria aegeria]